MNPSIWSNHFSYYWCLACKNWHYGRLSKDYKWAECPKHRKVKFAFAEQNGKEETIYYGGV